MHHVLIFRTTLSAIMKPDILLFLDSKWDNWFDMLDESNIFHEKVRFIVAKGCHHICFQLVSFMYLFLSYDQQRKPTYIVSGNHDVEGVLATGVMYQAYENRFRMPRIQEAIIGKVTKQQDIDLNQMYRLPYDYGNSFYSYTTGMLQNIVLNAFADFEPESNQYRWLLTELESVDRHQTPWVMISVHCPIYNTFSTHQHDLQPLQMKKYLEPLFVKYHVNFVVSGHMHAYSRSKNVANDSLASTGPMHIVLGNGGRQLNAPFQSEVPEEWVAIRDHTTYGFGTIQVLNKTSALYEWVQSGRTDASSKHYFNDAPDNMTDLVYVENQYFL